jgi:hypothetical protein
MPSGHSRRVEMADVFDIVTYAGNYIALRDLHAHKAISAARLILFSIRQASVCSFLIVVEAVREASV